MNDNETPGAARREILGEALGTFLLVFFGCGSVAAAVLTGAQVGVFQVAIVWGLGIALAIKLTGTLSGAHLNPAVTLALAVWQNFPARKIARYLGAQMLGAFLAAALVFAIFGDAFDRFESANHIIRGAPGSEASAMVFGEFFPNPGGKPLALNDAHPAVTHARAFGLELACTAVLMLVILGLTDSRRRGAQPAQNPWAIGLTVTALISLVGPLTMACFNPARDLGPRLFSALAGWGSVPFQANGAGWFTVYILAPILGAQLGACIHKFILSPAYASQKETE
jgi:glycerol uptake facilitator protein